jgi:hypothetical protein
MFLDLARSLAHCIAGAWVATCMASCGPPPALLIANKSASGQAPVCWQRIERIGAHDEAPLLERGGCGSVEVPPGRYRALLTRLCFTYAVEFEAQAQHRYSPQVCAFTGYRPEEIDDLAGRKPHRGGVDDMNLYAFESDLRVADETARRVVGFGGPQRGTYVWELMRRAGPSAETMRVEPVAGDDPLSRLLNEEIPWACEPPQLPERVTDSPYARDAGKVAVSDPYYERCRTR